MPVNEIPEEYLFTPVPLLARLDATNVTYVQDLVNRQRQAITKQAKVELATNVPPPPEMRLGSILFKFATPMDIPAGTKDRINKMLDQKKRRLESDSRDDQGSPNLFEIHAVYTEETDEN